MAQKVIFCFGTGTAQKVNSLKEFLDEHARTRYDIAQHEVHFFSDLNITPHSDPEESGFYSGNLDGKLIEIIKGIKKIGKEFAIKDGEFGSGVDIYILDQLGVSREDVLAGRVRIVFPEEDSGFIFTKINGDIRELISKTPEVFGDLAEYAKGLLDDDFIKATFERGFPGVETSPFLSAMGKENAIRFIKKVCELKGLEANPKNIEDIANSMGMIQQSYLSYFMWYPGMKLDEKNLPSLEYKSINTSNEGIFTAQILDYKRPSQVIEFEDCIIPRTNAENGDFRTIAELGYPFMGPFCRHELFERMLTDVTSFEFMQKSYNGHWQPSKPQYIGLKNSDITPRGFDIALITLDGQSVVINQLKARLPKAYNIKIYSINDIVDLSQGGSLYENIASIGNKLIPTSDCFIFEPVPRDISTVQRAALSAIQSELITHKHVTPAHRNKKILFLNENGCHNEEISLYNDMNKFGSLADPIEYRRQPRIGEIIDHIDDELPHRVIVSSNRYFRVDTHGHGYEKQLEKVTPYQPVEGETVKSILLSASMRGAYYNLALALTMRLLSQGHTISWGLGDKVSMMGAVNDAVKLHNRIGGTAKATGCSTKDIVGGETRSGVGVDGVNGRIYESLAARTEDLHLSSISGDIITSGGAGTLYEIDTLALRSHLTGVKKPITVATFREDDPVQIAARRRFEGRDDVNYVHGDLKSIISQVSAILREESMQLSADDSLVSLAR